MVGTINTYPIVSSFHSCPFYLFLFLLYLLAFLLCFFVLFQSYCSHAQVFGRILEPKFHISYWHIEWYLYFLAKRYTPYFRHSVACKNQNNDDNCCLPQPPIPTGAKYINKKFHFKNIFIKYIDYIYRIRKAKQGCGYTFRYVICTFFYILC